MKMNEKGERLVMTYKERSVLYYILWLESPTKEFLANYVPDVSPTLKTLAKKGYIAERNGFSKTYCLTIKGRLFAENYSAEISELAEIRDEIKRKNSMTFGEALERLKLCKKVARRGWNGKGLWLELQRPDENSKMTLPYVYLNYPSGDKYHDGCKVPWLPSQTDMLEEDWVEVE